MKRDECLRLRKSTPEHQLSLVAVLPGKDKHSVTQPEPGEIQKWEGLGGEGKPGVQSENPDHPVIPRAKAPTTASSARQDLINGSQRKMGK